MLALAEAAGLQVFVREVRDDWQEQERAFYQRVITKDSDNAEPALRLLPAPRRPRYPLLPPLGGHPAPNRGARPSQQPVATRMSPELSSTTRNVPSARMARPWAALTPVTRVLTVPDDRVTALIVPPPMSAT